MKRIGGLTFGVLLAAIGCAPMRDVDQGRAADSWDVADTASSSAASSDPELSLQPADVAALRVWDGRTLDAKVDPFSLDSVDVSEDELRLRVSYSGGCEKHEFAVWWSGEFARGDAGEIVVDLRISHDANNDTCEAFLSTELRVDVSSIRLERVEADSSVGLMLRFGDGGQVRTYEWEP